MTPWFHIIIGVGVYIFFALSASFVISKTGRNHKDMESRTSPIMMVIGAVTNLCVLILILLLLKYLDGRSISSLSLLFRGIDFYTSLLGIIAILGTAVAFVVYLKKKRITKVDFQIPFKTRSAISKMIITAGVLFIVALQEEVLYRGYITLNLISKGPLIVILVSTIIFTAIHLFTNRASLYQIISWLLGGALFSYVYLVSGTIWVPVILHFATDLINVIIFNIAGKYSFFIISPSLTKRQMATYKIITTAALVSIFLIIYGPTLRMI